MARHPGKPHIYRIISHTIDQQGTAVRVLLGCECSATEVLRPHQGKKSDPGFLLGLQNYPHLCCTNLPIQ